MGVGDKRLLLVLEELGIGMWTVYFCQVYVARSSGPCPGACQKLVEEGLSESPLSWNSGATLLREH